MPSNWARIIKLLFFNWPTIMIGAIVNILKILYHLIFKIILVGMGELITSAC